MKVKFRLGDEIFDDLERYLKVAREADELLGQESSVKFLDEMCSFINGSIHPRYVEKFKPVTGTVFVDPHKNKRKK